MHFFALNILATVLIGMFIGIISMIPIGAVQLQIIKKSLKGHLRAAVMTAIGSVSSDCIYGAIVLFGISSFVTNRTFQIVLYAAGILLLSGIFIKMYRDRGKPVNSSEDVTPKYHGRLSFVSGFSIAFFNPGMIIWWIFGYHFFVNLSLFEEITTTIKIIFLTSACIGLGGYLIAIALIVYKLKMSFSEKFLRRVNIFIFSLFGILIIYFIFMLLRTLLNAPVDVPNNI